MLLALAQAEIFRLFHDAAFCVQHLSHFIVQGQVQWSVTERVDKPLHGRAVFASLASW
jgi:hypothetical protein